MVLFIHQFWQDARWLNGIVNLIAVSSELIFRMNAAGMDDDIVGLQEVDAFFNATRPLDCRFGPKATTLQVADHLGIAAIAVDRPLQCARYALIAVRIW